jgi:hypothetical protein
MFNTPILIWDYEIARNGWFVGFMNPTTREVAWIDDTDPDRWRKFRQLMQWGGTLCGFNSRSFDMVILAACMADRPCNQVKIIGDTVIKDRLWPWAAYRQFGLKEPMIDGIDLIEPAPSFVSLKAYGARMNSKTIQDLPYDHRLPWTQGIREETRAYCVNDLSTTVELYDELAGEIKLRVEVGAKYGIDCRSLSDTQMAGAIFDERLNLRRSKHKIPKTVTYTPPAYLDKAKHPELRKLIMEMRNHEYVVNQGNGHVYLPGHIAEVRNFLGGIYQPGVGGLHSKHDRKVCYLSNSEVEYVEIDAASYYPSILIQAGMAPAGLGQKFIREYQAIYDQRMAAKRSGDTVTNESLKISLNGSFGLTAAKHSTLYDPSVMLFITLTGQLTLLQLIEWVYACGADCVSANTDGIVVAIPTGRRPEVEEAVTRYEKLTGYVFEYTNYKTLAMKDVNNYYAVTQGGKIKRKGIYAPPSLRKNASASVCANAVQAWLVTGKSIGESVREGAVVDYLSARNVTGGGVQGDTFLGKVVRWYMTTEPDYPPLTYKKNGNKVPKTEGAKACMTIKSYEVHPPDLDYEWYHAEAVKIACSIGAERFLQGGDIPYIPVRKKSKRSKKA